MRDGAETVLLMIATWLLGATAVPIDFRKNAAERTSLAREFGLTAIIEDRRMPAAEYDSIVADAAWTDLVVQHDGSPISTAGDGPVAAAVISLTSGTTARPIGILLDHERMLLRSICDIPLLYGESLLNPLPLSFSGSRSHTFSALLNGSAVFFHPVLFSAEAFAEAILSWKVTSVCAVPTIIRNLIELFRGRSPPAFDQLHALYSIGAPMLPEEKRQTRTVLCKNFVEDYGSSLSGRISSLYGSDLDARADTVGRVMPFVALQIVDADDAVLPFGETGIIRVRTPGMARAIYGDTTRASGDILKKGWAYPGDIGMIEKGFLRLSGRTSELIIRGGVNVHPSEVESVIAEHEGVRDVAVVGYPKLPEGQEIAAFVVPSDNLTEAVLIAHCRARLSPDKRPRKFVFIKELPLNDNGKISRAELRRQLETGAFSLAHH